MIPCFSYTLLLLKIGHSWEIQKSPSITENLVFHEKFKIGRILCQSNLLVKGLNALEFRSSVRKNEKGFRKEFAEPFKVVHEKFCSKKEDSRIFLFPMIYSNTYVFYFTKRI